MFRQTWLPNKWYHPHIPHRPHLHHHPGSHLLFPTRRTTTPTPNMPTPPPTPATTTPRGTMMPTRRRTRAADRAHRIKTERALNTAHVAERNMPPPF